MMSLMKTPKWEWAVFSIVLITLLVGACEGVTPTSYPISIQTKQATLTPSPFPVVRATNVNNTGQTDTGYEGYYMGVVTITEYYTLLDNELFEEAYQILSSSAQGHSKNQLEYVEIAQLVFETVEIVNVQPLVIWRREQGILSTTTPDHDDNINFLVQIRSWGKDGMSGSVKNGDLQTLFLTVIKEDGEWKIDSFATSPSSSVDKPIPVATLDPGSVPDRSYYDSIIVIAQFHVLFNHGLYERAYQLLSPFRRHVQSLEEFISDIETFGIIERRIISILPFYESTVQLRDFTTPNPASRRMFYAQIYARGKGGWAGSVPNGTYGYYITTVLENAKWKIYSVNTVGLP